MAYDDKAKAVAIKAIGTVESSLNYHAVNYNDPITIGIMQWYGTRAANILFRIRDEKPSAWVGIPKTLTDDMLAHPATDAWWNDRWLVSDEGESLKGALESARDIQNDQAAKDLDAYVTTARTLMIDVDGNTNMMLLFFTALHQSPARAKRLINAIGPDSSIDRLLASLLNETVFSRYRTRYNTAYQIIMTGDSTGVDVVPTPVPTPEPTDPDDSAATTRAPGPVLYARKVGDAIHVRLAGRTIVCLASGDLYEPSRDTGVGATPVQPPEPQPPVVTPPSDADGKRAAVVKWMTDRLGKFRYGQVPGRLDPDNSGVTDCSGSVRTAYRTTLGIDPGNSSRDQAKTGTRVYEGKAPLPVAQMLPGDLIFYSHSSNIANVYHVAMYMGGGQRVHTGRVGGMNPNVDSNIAGPAGDTLWVNRYI